MWKLLLLRAFKRVNTWPWGTSAWLAAVRARAGWAGLAYIVPCRFTPTELGWGGRPRPACILAADTAPLNA